jgi:hypothetical protein
MADIGDQQKRINAKLCNIRDLAVEELRRRGVPEEEIQKILTRRRRRRPRNV